MVELERDETAEPGPSDRDLTEDGTGRLGLAFNNPYLQRVYCGLDVLAAIAARFRVYITRSNNTGSVSMPLLRREVNI